METLYGTWRIRGGNVDRFIEHGFTIAGSTNADGRYLPTDPDFELVVEGARWEVALEQRSLQSNDWIQQRIYRTTAFDPKQGLITRLDSHHPPPTGPHILIYYPGIELICVCEDPAVDVRPPDEPYNFTYPKGSRRPERPLRRLPS